MISIRAILHPTDFSENSKYAFQRACSLAHDHHARLILLHVMIPAMTPLLPVPPPNPMQPAEAQESLHGRFAWPEPLDRSIEVQHRVS
jgi:nucleotide-binding universal stress UspA family protein